MEETLREQDKVIIAGVHTGALNGLLVNLFVSSEMFHSQ